MIELFKKVTKKHYRKKDSPLQASVTIVEQGEDSDIVETSICITDDNDYEYVRSNYSVPLGNNKILELVSLGFEQASTMKYAPSKFGEDIPEITPK